jgi:cytochrome c2
MSPGSPTGARGPSRPHGGFLVAHPRFVVAAYFTCAAVLLSAASLLADAPEGKKLFGAKGCTACHNVGAPSNGPGPELTQIAYQRDRAWMRAWLTDPKKIKPDTVMPKPAWSSGAEIDDVIDYLFDSKRPIPAADSANGEKLIADYGCNTCHAIHKKGGKPQFPDLANEAKKHDAAFLDRWLKNPKSVQPSTFMATFPLTDTQRKALVDYILSLRASR